MSFIAAEYFLVNNDDDWVRSCPPSIRCLNFHVGQFKHMDINLIIRSYKTSMTTSANQMQMFSLARDILRNRVEFASHPSDNNFMVLFIDCDMAKIGILCEPDDTRAELGYIGTTASIKKFVSERIMKLMKFSESINWF